MGFFGRLLYPIERVFLWSSGADLDALQQVPTEKSKYYGIGGTIVFTALMASFAGGYAFFTAFKDTGLSIFFGFFWGALIFNLDRYIVSSFGVGDGKRTISMQEVIEASPRLLMAALLGFVISTPLELKLFEGEIEAWIAEDIALHSKEIEKDHNLNTDPDIQGWRKDLQAIEAELASMNTNEQNKPALRDTADMAQEREWVHGCSKHPPGKGSHHTELMQRYTDAKSEYTDLIASNMQRKSDLQQDRTDLNKKIAEREESLMVRRQSAIAESDKSRGLMKRLEGLAALTSRSAAVWWSKWLITLLFVFIEIAPVLFKMMTERGPYDDIVEQKKYEVLLAQQLRRSKLNEDANATLKANRSNQEEFLKAEMEKNKLLLQQIVEAQNEIAAEAIRSWKEQQLAKVQQNVNDYVRTGNTLAPEMGSTPT